MSKTDSLRFFFLFFAWNKILPNELSFTSPNYASTFFLSRIENFFFFFFFRRLNVLAMFWKYMWEGNNKKNTKRYRNENVKINPPRHVLLRLNFMWRDNAWKHFFSALMRPLNSKSGISARINTHGHPPDMQLNFSVHSYRFAWRK